MKPSFFTSRSSIGNGSVLLILVFSVLCLTIFALLTISSARAEQNLTERTAASVAAYYQADSLAEEVFSLIRASISEDQGIPDAVLGVAVTSYAASNYGEKYITYSIAVGEANLLAVSLIFYQTRDEFDIEQWRLIPAAEWQPEEEFHLWDGKFVTGD